MTLATPRVVPVRRAKAFIERKVARLRLPGLPYLSMWDIRLLELSRPPRRVCTPNVNGWLVLQRNKLKVTSSRVTRGDGCLGHLRPYIWGLKWPAIDCCVSSRVVWAGHIFDLVLQFEQSIGTDRVLLSATLGPDYTAISARFLEQILRKSNWRLHREWPSPGRSSARAENPIPFRKTGLGFSARAYGLKSWKNPM